MCTCMECVYLNMYTGTHVNYVLCIYYVSMNRRKPGAAADVTASANRDPKKKNK